MVFSAVAIMIARRHVRGPERPADRNHRRGQRQRGRQTGHFPSATTTTAAAAAAVVQNGARGVTAQQALSAERWQQQSQKTVALSQPAAGQACC